MSRIFRVNVSKMTEESGNVTLFCEDNSIDRKTVYEINGKKRHHKKENIALRDKLIKLGYGYWEDKGEEA